jgi:hypothetical protein
MTAEGDALRRLARSSGLSVREVRRFVDLEVVQVGGGPAGPALVARLRRLRRLRYDLGLSVDATVIVIRLLDRIEVLEARKRS